MKRRHVYSPVTAGSLFVSWAVALGVDRLYGFAGWPRYLAFIAIGAVVGVVWAQFVQPADE